MLHSAEFIVLIQFPMNVSKVPWATAVSLSQSDCLSPKLLRSGSHFVGARKEQSE